MEESLLKKMQPSVLQKILAYFDLMLRLQLMDEKAHTKAKERILDLVMNNM
jgi:hypothetical protein